MNRGRKTALGILLVVALVACPAVPPQTVAYRTIATVAVSVDTAMKGWADWVRANGRCIPATPAPNCVTAAAEGKVRTAFTKYKQGENAAHKAIDAWRAATAAGAPTSSAALDDAMRAVQDSATAVVTAVSQQKGGN